jgi:hypothetical protein
VRGPCAISDSNVGISVRSNGAPTNACTRYIVRRGRRYGASGGSTAYVRENHYWSAPRRTRSGRWTLCTMRWNAAARSECNGAEAADEGLLIRGSLEIPEFSLPVNFGFG